MKISATRQGHVETSYTPWAEQRRNLIRDPRFTLTAGQWSIVGTSSAPVAGGVATATIGPTPPTSNFLTPTQTTWFYGNDGDVYSAGYEVENVGTTPGWFRVAFYNGAVYAYGPVVTVAPGKKERVSFTAIRPAGSSYFQPRLHTAGVTAGWRIQNL